MYLSPLRRPFIWPFTTPDVIVEALWSIFGSENFHFKCASTSNLQWNQLQISENKGMIQQIILLPFNHFIHLASIPLKYQSHYIMTQHFIDAFLIKLTFFKNKNEQNKIRIQLIEDACQITSKTNVCINQMMSSECCKWIRTNVQENMGRKGFGSYCGSWLDVLEWASNQRRERFQVGKLKSVKMKALDFDLATAPYWWAAKSKPVTHVSWWKAWEVSL